MDFQLKTLTLSRAAAEKADALIVLFADGAIDGQEPLARLAAEARKAGEELVWNYGIDPWFEVAK